MTDLALRELTVRYGNRDAVHPLSLTVPSGGWLCLIGPNGAGKSSVMRDLRSGPARRRHRHRRRGPRR